MKKITEDDIRMVKYFWDEKGDVKRWAEWNEHLADFEKEFPELVKVVQDYDMAKKILNAVIKGIEA